jgi:endoglucanase
LTDVNGGFEKEYIVQKAPVTLSRRNFVISLLTSAAWPHVVLSQATPEPLADLSGCFAPHSNDITFVGSPMGDSALVLTIEETVLREDPPKEITLGSPITLTLDPNHRRGARGLLGRVNGDFSAARHATAPQIFRILPEVMSGTAASLFAPLIVSIGGVVAADAAANWEVAIDGVRVPVARVCRKTVPINTATLGNGDRASRRRHLVTLILDDRFASASKIEVAADGLPNLTIDAAAPTPSEIFHVCTAGYPADGPKSVYVGLWLGVDVHGESLSSDLLIAVGARWTLVDAKTGAVVTEGELTLAKAVGEPHADGKNFNGCCIWEANFSDINMPGTYRLKIEGLGVSADIVVAETPYEDVFRAAARLYFHQRSGCEIEKKHGEGRQRPRNGHPEDGLIVWQSAVQLGRTSEGFMHKPQSNRAVAATPIGDQIGAATNDSAWGGWHDAGDWDRRIQHMDPVYAMAHMVETLQSARTLSMNIPESGLPFAHPDVAARRGAMDRGDGVTVLPDLIHEALWGISLWRRTQGADGSIIGGVEYSLDGISGSVSWNPVQNTYAYAVEEWAAYRFALAAAKLGHVVANICGDAVLGAALIAEAEQAWDWAETANITDEMASDDFARERILRARSDATGTLYRATGREDILAVFEESNAFKTVSVPDFKISARANVIGPALDYVRSGEEGRAINNEIAASIVNWASSRGNAIKRMGADYGLHTSDTYPFGNGWMRFGPGSNWPASMLALELGTKNADITALYRKAVQGMWFALGCNPANVSFVQGFGTRQFGDPLLMDLSRQCKFPGLLSFGVAGGNLRQFETDKVAGAIYPADEEKWPIYARIFESSAVPICSEFGVRSVAMEWLYASAVVSELKRLIDAGLKPNVTGTTRPQSRPPAQ